MPKIQIDLRFVEIEYELWGLGQFLSFLEPQIQEIIRQDRRNTFADLKKRGWDHDEIEVGLATQELSEREAFIIPRFMRGPFLVSLWACYESALGELANFHRQRISARLAFADVRA